MIREYKGGKLHQGKEVFIAETANIIGDVTLGDNTSVWYNAVLRADLEPIKIGNNTSIQDNCTLHVVYNGPVIVGDNVTIGHNAIVHGATIEDNCMIGMGAIVLDHAVIGRGSIIGAGSVVSPGKIIPPHSQVLGIPGKVVKELPEDKEQWLIDWAKDYVDLSRNYLNE